MKNDIQELYDSLHIKKALQELNITNISELKEYNCLTLANKLPKHYDKVMIIRKLNDLGYLPSAENKILIYDIAISRKRRIFFEKWYSIPFSAFCVSKRRNIAVSQLSDCSERQLKVTSDSVPALTSLIEKIMTNTHMDKDVD